MNETRLIEKAQRGDAQALDELCHREWRSVYTLLYAALQNRPETEDATREVFLRALRSFDRYQHQDIPFRAYLAIIAENLLRDHWRRSSPMFVHFTDQADPPANEPLLVQQVLDAVRQRSMSELLDTLNDDQRDVIRLRILDGRSTDEVAAIMNRTPDAVRQLQHRAITALRQRMQEGSQV